MICRWSLEFLNLSTGPSCQQHQSAALERFRLGRFADQGDAPHRAMVQDLHEKSGTSKNLSPSDPWRCFLIFGWENYGSHESNSSNSLVGRFYRKSCYKKSSNFVSKKSGENMRTPHPESALWLGDGSKPMTPWGKYDEQRTLGRGNHSGGFTRKKMPRKRCAPPGCPGKHLSVFHTIFPGVRYLFAGHLSPDGKFAKISSTKYPCFPSFITNETYGLNPKGQPVDLVSLTGIHRTIFENGKNPTWLAISLHQGVYQVNHGKSSPHIHVDIPSKYIKKSQKHIKIP